MDTHAVNINLKPCTCRSITPYGPANIGECLTTCAGAPVLVPLPLEPWRTVRMKVRLGECIPSCSARGRAMLTSGRSSEHYPDCPAHPANVSCSIRGKTWEESEVVDVDADFNHPINTARQMEIARARWALVKALVLGQRDFITILGGRSPTNAEIELMVQRDAVFAALADMARLEDAHAMARQRAYDAVDSSGHTADSEHLRARAKTRDSVDALAHYIDRLIEQVGALA